MASAGTAAAHGAAAAAAAVAAVAEVVGHSQLSTNCCQRSPRDNSVRQARSRSSLASHPLPRSHSLILHPHPPHHPRPLSAPSVVTLTQRHRHVSCIDRCTAQQPQPRHHSTDRCTRCCSSSFLHRLHHVYADLG